MAAKGRANFPQPFLSQDLLTPGPPPLPPRACFGTSRSAAPWLPPGGHCHDLQVLHRIALGRLARRSEARAWRAADGVFTVTHVLAEQIAATGVDPERIVITPNGVDLQRFRALPSSDEAKAALGLYRPH